MKNRLEPHSLIVGVDFSAGADEDVMIVAISKKGNVKTIVNALKGEEARELYSRLVTPKNSINEFDTSLS